VEEGEQKVSAEKVANGWGTTIDDVWLIVDHDGLGLC
jgi:hypothetical protein